MNGTSSCPVCGCREFFKEHGFFYCEDCQTQCEGIRVFDVGFVKEKDAENEVELITSQVFGRRRRRNQKSADKKGEDFTSWEMFNFVLRGQVEELMALGAPPSIKMTVLQLWSHYLQKKSVAFFSKEKTVLPKANKTLLRRDAKLMFGISDKKPNSKKANKNQVKEMNPSLSHAQDWSSMKIKKRIHSQMKKAMMSKITELSVASNPGCTSCILDESNILNDTINIDEDMIQDVLEREYLPESAYTLLSPEEKEGNDSSENAFKKFGFHLNRVTRLTLILLLYLSLLYEGSDICLSDIIRWIREGHLSYLQVSHFLPENVFVEGQAMHQFKVVNDIPCYESLRERSAVLARYLGMVDWPIPNSSSIAKKYVNELHLPVIFCDYIQQLINLTPDLFYAKSPADIPCYEGRVLAVLVIIMKIMFGLDGKTEHKISKAASKLNVWLSNKKSKHRKKLFVWNDWVKQLICRNAILSEHNIHIKHVISPETIGNPSLFINYFKKMEEDHKKSRHKYQYKKSYLTDTHPGLINFFSHILEKLDSPEVTKNDVDFPACTTPYYLYTSKILEKSLEVDNLITDKAREILSEDFSDSDVSYLFCPFSMRKLVEKHGHNLKTSASAQKSFRVYRSCPDKTDMKRYMKGKCYVAVTQCRRLSILASKKKRKTAEMSFVDHVEEEKKESLYLNELVSKALSMIDNKKRKTPIVKHNPKKRKQENELMKRKTLDLNLPHQQYWVLHDKWCTNEKTFDSQIFVKFSFSFAWFLSECALLSEMKKFDLYKELVFMEKYYEEYVLPKLLQR